MNTFKPAMTRTMYKMGITTDCICSHRFTASKNMYAGKDGIIALLNPNDKKL